MDPDSAKSEDCFNRRGAEAQRINLLTEGVIGAAIEVHRELGPGLLESAYQNCLCHELSLQCIPFRRKVELPVKYKGVLLDCGYEIDILVDGLVIIEIKAVEKLHPVHEAQLFTYLKLYGAPVGLLMNFHSPVLRTGLKRIVHNF